MSVFPVPLLAGRPPKISQGFGGGSGNHRGIDIMYRRPSSGAALLPVFSKNYEMPNGVPALAFMAGKVTRASMIGTGGRVRIDHGNGLETAYYHLRKPAMQVGEVVKEGQVVGDIYHNTSAPTATRTPYKLNHLHFEVFRNGNAIDPASLLRTARVVAAPISQGAFLIKVTLAVGLGLVLSKYVFR